MSRKLFSLWGGLPDFCAVAAVVWCLSYAFTLGYVGAHIGRQSSTFAIGVGLPILAAPVLAAVGLVIGRIAAYALRSVLERWSRTLKWSAPVALVAIALLAAWQASTPLYAAERAARPRVIQNTAQIVRRSASLPAEGIARGMLAYDSLKQVNRTIPWETGSAQLVNRGEVLEVAFASTGTSLQIPVPGIDYITHVDAMAVKLGASARPALALLITGRATGRRDLIAVISESRELIYLELLDRFWNFDEVSVASAPSAAGDLILVGSEPERLLVFAPPDSA